MADKYTPLKQKYAEQIREELKGELGLSNIMAVPTVQKIVLNIGAGKTKDDANLMNELVDTLAQITGQKPVITNARMAVSNFKVREGMPVGLMVTLRGKKMWYFLDKLINIALPRTKDFRGVSPKSFDGNGNYSLGIKDQTIFPEIDTSKNIRLHGLQISIITSTNKDSEASLLLKKLGMPFRAN